MIPVRPSSAPSRRGTWREYQASLKHRPINSGRPARPATVGIHEKAPIRYDESSRESDRGTAAPHHQPPREECGKLGDENRALHAESGGATSGTNEDRLVKEIKNLRIRTAIGNIQQGHFLQYGVGSTTVNHWRIDEEEVRRRDHLAEQRVATARRLSEGQQPTVFESCLATHPNTQVTRPSSAPGGQRSASPRRLFLTCPEGERQPSQSSKVPSVGRLDHPAETLAQTRIGDDAAAHPSTIAGNEWQEPALTLATTPVEDKHAMERVESNVRGIDRIHENTVSPEGPLYPPTASVTRNHEANWSQLTSTNASRFVHGSLITSEELRPAPEPKCYSVMGTDHCDVLSAANLSGDTNYGAPAAGLREGGLAPSPSQETLSIFSDNEDCQDSICLTVVAESRPRSASPGSSMEQATEHLIKDRQKFDRLYGLNKHDVPLTAFADLSKDASWAEEASTIGDIDDISEDSIFLASAPSSRPASATSRALASASSSRPASATSRALASASSSRPVSATSQGGMDQSQQIAANARKLLLASGGGVGSRIRAARPKSAPSGTRPAPERYSLTEADNKFQGSAQAGRPSSAVHYHAKARTPADRKEDIREAQAAVGSDAHEATLEREGLWKASREDKQPLARPRDVLERDLGANAALAAPLLPPAVYEVGDRVQVIRDGRVATISSRDNGDVKFPYKVRFQDGQIDWVGAGDIVAKENVGLFLSRSQSGIHDESRLAPIDPDDVDNNTRVPSSASRPASAPLSAMDKVKASLLKDHENFKKKYCVRGQPAHTNTEDATRIVNSLARMRDSDTSPPSNTGCYHYDVPALRRPDHEGLSHRGGTDQITNDMLVLPRYTRQTVKHWFDLMMQSASNHRAHNRQHRATRKNLECLSRRELIHVLRSDEKLFDMFCGAFIREAWRERIQAGRVTSADALYDEINRRPMALQIRLGVMKKSLDVLDRIALPPREGDSHWIGLPLIIEYFQQQGMLLDFVTAPHLNVVSNGEQAPKHDLRTEKRREVTAGLDNQFTMTTVEAKARQIHEREDKGDVDRGGGDKIEDIQSSSYDRRFLVADGRFELPEYEQEAVPQNLLDNGVTHMLSKYDVKTIEDIKPNAPDLTRKIESEDLVLAGAGEDKEKNCNSHIGDRWMPSSTLASDDLVSRMGAGDAVSMCMSEESTRQCKMIANTSPSDTELRAELEQARARQTDQSEDEENVARRGENVLLEKIVVEKGPTTQATEDAISEVVVAESIITAALKLAAQGAGQEKELITRTRDQIEDLTMTQLADFIGEDVQPRGALRAGDVGLSSEDTSIGFRNQGGEASQMACTAFGVASPIAASHLGRTMPNDELLGEGESAGLPRQGDEPRETLTTYTARAVSAARSAADYAASFGPAQSSNKLPINADGISVENQRGKTLQPLVGEAVPVASTDQTAASLANRFAPAGTRNDCSVSGSACEWRQPDIATPPACHEDEPIRQPHNCAVSSQEVHSTIAKGARVVAQGIKSAARYNGQVGKVVNWNSSRGYWNVRFQSGEVVALKAENLIVQTLKNQDESGSVDDELSAMRHCEEVSAVPTEVLVPADLRGSGAKSGASSVEAGVVRTNAEPSAAAAKVDPPLLSFSSTWPQTAPSSLKPQMHETDVGEVEHLRMLAATGLRSYFGEDSTKEARRKSVDEAKRTLKVEEDARSKAEEAAKTKAAAEARTRAEGEVSARTAVLAKANDEEEDQTTMEEETKPKVEKQERRRRTEEEATATLKAEEDARSQIEEAAKTNVEEEVTIRAEDNEVHLDMGYSEKSMTPISQVFPSDFFQGELGFDTTAESCRSPSHVSDYVIPRHDRLLVENFLEKVVSKCESYAPGGHAVLPQNDGMTNDPAVSLVCSLVDDLPQFSFPLRLDGDGHVDSGASSVQSSPHRPVVRLDRGAQVASHASSVQGSSRTHSPLYRPQLRADRIGEADSSVSLSQPSARSSNSPHFPMELLQAVGDTSSVQMDKASSCASWNPDVAF